MTPRSRTRRGRQPPTGRRGQLKRDGSPRAQPGARGPAAPTPEPSARYTPARPAFRIRPAAHKVVGWALVALGVAIAVLNDVQWASSRLSVLPGGHSELYLMVAVAVAAFGAWWLGLFDRPTS